MDITIWYQRNPNSILTGYIFKSGFKNKNSIVQKPMFRPIKEHSTCESMLEYKYNTLNPHLIFGFLV